MDDLNPQNSVFKEVELEEAPKLVPGDDSDDQSETGSMPPNEENDTLALGSVADQSAAPEPATDRGSSQSPLWRRALGHTKTVAIVFLALAAVTAFRHSAGWYTKLPRPKSFNPIATPVATSMSVMSNPEIAYSLMFSNSPELANRVKAQYFKTSHTPISQLFLLLNQFSLIPPSDKNSSHPMMNADEYRTFLESVTKQYPDNFVLQYVLANTYAAHGDHVQSEAALDKTLSIWNANAATGVGYSSLPDELLMPQFVHAFEGQGRPEIALKYLDLYPRLRDDSAASCLFRCCAYRAVKDYNRAIQAGLDGLKAGKFREEIRSELVRALIAAGKYEEAKKQAADLYPFSRERLERESLLAQKKWKEYLNRADNELSGERADRALALLKLGRNEEALRIATECLDSQNPAWTTANALRVRAQANLALKKFPEALRDARDLLRCNPKDAIAQSIVDTIGRERPAIR